MPDFFTRLKNTLSPPPPADEAPDLFRGFVHTIGQEYLDFGEPQSPAEEPKTETSVKEKTTAEA